MKYSSALTFFLIVIGSLLFVTKISSAQTISSRLASKQIPTIDPAIAQEANKYTRHRAACPKPNDSLLAHCFAHVILDNNDSPFTMTKPAGFGPAEFRKAYNVSGEATTTPIVAIIDAYDQPNILSDLQTYSNTFNLPQLPTCAGIVARSKVACFKKIDQTGETNYPKTDAGWALEISLDVEAVYAMCDNCSILLVEATSPTNANLLKAVDTAINLGATVLSNSYGSNETLNETNSDSHFNQPGITIFASSGDSGYGVNYPASSRYVVSVGGTKLTLTSSGAYSTESAWADGGSGCSSYETKPSWQQDTGCGKRTVVDISADADPTSGAAVYDSVPYNGKKGWFKIGGTSLSSPLIAGIFATSDQLPKNKQAGSFLYSLSTDHFHDIIKGTNGVCFPTYLCKAAKGYDALKVLGSPNGIF